MRYKKGNAVTLEDVVHPHHDVLVEPLHLDLVEPDEGRPGV
jgi:hypothetical protein